jgi:hypothetical protein
LSGPGAPLLNSTGNFNSDPYASENDLLPVENPSATTSSPTISSRSNYNFLQQLPAPIFSQPESLPGETDEDWYRRMHGDHRGVPIIPAQKFAPNGISSSPQINLLSGSPSRSTTTRSLGTTATSGTQVPV